MSKILKVLMLCDHDSKLSGHIQNDYLNMPDSVEAHMVTLEGLYRKTEYCYYYRSNFNSILSLLFHRLWRFFYCLIKLGCFLKIDKTHGEYCYMDFEYYPYSAKSILRKCPTGFVPDIIAVYWTQGFISSRVVNELYKITKAKIVYILVDEAALTGGCHYPNECKAFLKECDNCPALIRGKKLASKQLMERRMNLADIPLYIYGVPFDLRIASKTKTFCNAKQIPLVKKPEVIRTSKSDARKNIGLPENGFVVMVGSARRYDVRKGVVYSIEALNQLEKCIPNLIVLSAGNAPLQGLSESIRHKSLGFVDMNHLFEAFCASDCFLSTTIADSGPMMVNFSIALGIPVISFPIGIAADLVIHKETGFLAKFKDVSDIKEGIMFMSLRDEALKQSMYKRCIDLMEEIGTNGCWIDYFIDYENRK